MASSATPFRFWIAEEQQHCIADKFVDGCAMLKRNHGHLGEVMIENVRQLLQFQVVRRFGEACDIGEADCKLLSFGGDLDVLFASKNRLINLRR